MRVTIPTIEELLAKLTAEQREKFASDVFMRGTGWLRIDCRFDDETLRFVYEAKIVDPLKVMQVE